MKYTILFAAILFVQSVSAQDCTQALLLQTKGELKADHPYAGEALKAADLPRHKNVLAVISKMIKSKYTPMGVEANYHENYGNTSQYWQPNNYSYSIIPLNYYCEGNAVKIVGEVQPIFLSMLIILTLKFMTLRKETG